MRSWMSWNDADRLAELLALLRVFERVLRRRPSGTPVASQPTPDRVSRSTCAVSRNELAFLQAVRLRHPAVGHGDLAVLDHLERHLVLDLLDAEAGRRLVLDDEALDLVVVDVARPDDRDVAPGRVADPLLLAVEDPGVALALRRRREAAAGSGAHQRLGQAEAADLLQARHRRQPLLLLLLGARERRSSPWQDRCGRRRRSRTTGRRAHISMASRPISMSLARCAAVAMHAEAADVELLERRDQLEREGIFDPVLVDDRRDLGLHEVAHLLEDRSFLGAQACPRFDRSRCSAAEAAFGSRRLECSSSGHFDLHFVAGPATAAGVSFSIASNIVKRPAGGFASRALVLSFVAGDRGCRCKCGE